MIGMMVMEAIKGKDLQGLGHQFAVIPRVGKYIGMNDDNGIGQVYEVLAEIHADVPDPDGAADLIVRHAGTDVDLRLSVIS